MLKIRLQRVGRKHEPVFRLVLTDSQNATKSGKFLEVLGNYDARRGDKAEFDSERIKYWIGQGAKPSDTIFNLLIDKKIIEGKKINKLPKKTATKKIEELKVDSAEDSSEAKGSVGPKEEVVTETEALAKEEPPAENTTETEVGPDKPVEEVVEEKAS